MPDAAVGKASWAPPIRVPPGRGLAPSAATDSGQVAADHHLICARCRKVASGQLIPHGEVFEAAVDDGIQALDLAGDLEPLEALQQQPVDHLDLEPGEVGAHAEVLAE